MRPEDKCPANPLTLEALTGSLPPTDATLARASLLLTAEILNASPRNHLRALPSLLSLLLLLLRFIRATGKRSAQYLARGRQFRFFVTELRPLPIKATASIAISH